jgi:hypothetical protein
MQLPLIRTQRMLLRPWLREGADALHALSTAPEVRRSLWDDVVITRDTVVGALESHLAMQDRHNIGF